MQWFEWLMFLPNQELMTVQMQECRQFLWTEEQPAGVMPLPCATLPP